jgi:hypothetical protein
MQLRIVEVKKIVNEYTQGESAEKFILELSCLPSIFISEDDFSSALEHFLNIRIREIDA